jgi:Gram-negative bacterial TonB protein C-terminal
MRAAITVLWLAAFCGGVAFAQLGANCASDEHNDILRNRSGKIVWFTSEQLKKMAIQQPQPETPSRLAGFHIAGYVSFKILVDRNGLLGCIWDQVGNPSLGKAANEALQYWAFKPMVVNGKPVEFVGTVRFYMTAN